MVDDAGSGKAPMEPRVIGRYALFGEIAAGGMATVHFGRLVGPVGFSRTVAIKRLHPQYAKDPDFVAMFLDEARLASRVQHPNVVTTLDVVATSDEVFLVMEYVQGESLSRLARNARKDGTRMPYGHVATVMAGVLHGLHAAHEAKSERREALNIVHRDVSPQNVLVGTDGVARVLDFGVAKAAMRAGTTRDKQMKGKLSYMSPEQLNAKPVDRRTDIFAAGVVLWEILCGKRLFDGSDAGEIFAKVLAGEIQPPKSVESDVPDSMNDVVMRALERNVDKRYQTARDFAIDLENSVPLATGRAVGEWVEVYARVELERRAQALAEIESFSATTGDLARLTASEAGAHRVDEANSMPSISGVQTTTGFRRPSSVPAPEPEVGTDSEQRPSAIEASTSAVASLAMPGRPGSSRPPASRRMWVGALLASLAGGVLAFLLFRGGGSTPATPSSGTQAPVATNAKIEKKTAPIETVRVEDLPTASPDVDAAPTEAPPAATAPRKFVSRRNARPAATVSASAPSCNPPFTIDDHGIKRLKAGCF
jgi:serine/threonine-protein kinase